uniref:hypothetical protein n=1 Tax=Agathobacter sp. TaxID=2021311 RepID=UPI0040570BDA
MRNMDELMVKYYLKGKSYVQKFLDSERGDTNFVSMLLIIGIVVVLAGLFLTLGKEVMASISENVTDFIDNL